MSSTISSIPSVSTTSSATATCTTAVPGKYGYIPPEACNALYSYYPSFGAAIFLAFLFGTVTGLHIFQAAKYKKTFCWVIIMGCIWELVSFILRAISTRNQANTNFYTYSFLLVLLAPLLINAFDYMVLGRMVYFYLPEQKLFHIPGNRFSRYFVWLDILAFLVQLGGGMLVSGTNIKPKTLQLGIHIYMGGIGMQQFFILIFTTLAIMFHRRVNELQAQGKYVEPGWKRLLLTLYASLALISARIIYRLVEYASGNGPSNPLPYHEAYFYCLDATPMFLAALIMCISHPGHFLKGPNSEFPKMSRKEKKAAKEAAKAAKKGVKDQARLLDPEEGYAGMGSSEVELQQTHGYERVQVATEPEATRYEPYGGVYGQDECYAMGTQARTAASRL